MFGRRKPMAGNGLPTTVPVLQNQTGFVSGMLQFFRGTGGIVTLAPGNLGNPPGNPPVETGNYEYIQDFAFQGQGHIMTDFAPVPPQYANWGQYAVNVADASGNTGGGISAGSTEDVGLPVENTLFYDPTTGQYYDLGEP